MARESARPKSRTLLIHELEELVGLKKSSIYNRLNPKSKYHDPTFPEQVSRGGSTGIGWDEEEVLAWVAARNADRCSKRSAARSVRKQGQSTDAFAQPENRKPLRPPAKAALRKVVKEVLVEAGKKPGRVTYYEFLKQVCARLPGNRVEVPDQLLNEIDEAAYRKSKALPTLVIQDRACVPVRAPWYLSALRVQVLGEAFRRHSERLFLACLAPGDPRPTGFSWTEGRGWASMKPIYAPVRPPSRRESPDPQRAAEEEARYADLLPK